MYKQRLPLPVSPAVNAVTQYAKKFNAQLLKEVPANKNYVASPLGAWLLLALIGNHNPTNSETVKVVEEYLGLPVDEAFTLATDLLANNPAPISAIAGAWFDSTIFSDLPHLSEWIEEAKKTMKVEDIIPSQQVLDKWTADNTKDLIKEFPLQVDDSVVYILANALATKISWREKFDVEPNSALPGWDVKHVLKSVEGHRHNLVQLPEGVFAVHSARSADGLAVYSVIGPKHLSAAEVAEKAQEIIANPERLSLFDLELGEEDHYVLTEEIEEGLSTQDDEVYVAYLPAWKASSHHNLTDALGFPEATKNFMEHNPALLPEVAQSAVAAYDKDGFEAAALTAMFFARASMPSRVIRPVRHALLKFNHPYVVIAVYEDVKYYPTDEQPDEKNWVNVPVFTAWVNTVEESEPREDKE